MELEHPDPVHEGRRRVLITGAGGQLGRALQHEFVAHDVLALSHADWDVATPPTAEVSQGDFDLLLHTAAWTDVDGAEADPQGAATVNIAGTANVASLGAPRPRVGNARYTCAVQAKSRAGLGRVARAIFGAR